MPAAFITGGSGFIGGVLIRRLVADGWSVRALARSEGSAARVRDLGAEAVMGDLSDPRAIEAGASGCEYAFHCAATTAQWGPREEFVRGNVDGTLNALEGCRAAGVRRFVHVGTEAALLAGEPLVNVDETAPLRPDSKAHYPATKAIAEQAVLGANADGFETVVLRPRLVWGPDDTTILPILTEMVKKGRFSWIGGGRHLTSTTHQDNTVEGLVLAATRGEPGNAYFVTDGDPVEFRDFMTRLLATAGVEAPTRSVPMALARPLAALFEGVWKALRVKSPPPLMRLTVWLSALETTIDITKARRDLGYAPVKTVEQGMAELRAPNPPLS
jgi:nucleoside-diphosphate-sugar epimerase